MDYSKPEVVCTRCGKRTNAPAYAYGSGNVGPWCPECTRHILNPDAPELPTFGTIHNEADLTELKRLREIIVKVNELAHIIDPNATYEPDDASQIFMYEECLEKILDLTEARK